MGRMPARLRSLLTLGLLDRASRSRGSARDADGALAALAADFAAGQARIEDRIKELTADVAALRSLLVARDDRAQRKLRGGFSSALNLLSILPELKIQGVLPSFPHQGFEISGELAVFLFHLIRREKPKLILELGSGSSTVLFAASLRANGAGRVISVEHDPEHRERTARFLSEAGLSDWAELVEAPLAPQSFGTLSLNWYDLRARLATLTEKIDLLFVDGPPGRLQALSRYPALPALGAHLAHDAVIVIDDGSRDDEVRMVELWRELDVPFEVETLGFLPRAPVLLRMQAKASRAGEIEAATAPKLATG